MGNSGLRAQLEDFQFGVFIDLGAGAIDGPTEVAAALREIATRIDKGEYTGDIADAMDNRVGEFHTEFWPPAESSRPPTEGTQE